MPTNVDDLIKRLSPVQRKKVEARAAELMAEAMTLRELRRARKLTQVRVAKKLGITQDSVSRLEKRSDLLLSTLRKTVEAMGGSLTLVAEFPHGVGRVLVVQGDLADTTVPNGLANKGWAIERVVAYSTRPRILSAEEAASIAECHAVTLYSPSAVHVLAAAKIALPPIIVTIGATTSAACIEYGWSPFESPATTNDAVAHRLTELLGELLTP